MTTAMEYSSSLAQSPALRSPLTALSAQSSWSLTEVYGHSWFVDPRLELSVVKLTNTTLEGMAGVFALAVRDAVYRGIAS